MARTPRSFLSASLLLLITGCGSDKFEKEVETELTATTVARHTVESGYTLMTAEELHDVVTKKEPALIIDTMPFEDSYAKEHVPGAVQFLFPKENMPEWKDESCSGTQADFQKLLGEDKQRRLIFYCGFVKCLRSHNGAAWARKLGYTNVVRQPGGIFAWKGKGYETESAE